MAESPPGMRSLAEEWALFEAHQGLRGNVSDELRENLRLMFYAGFAACRRAFDAALMAEDFDAEALATWSHGVALEVIDVAEALRADRAPFPRGDGA